MKLRDSDFISQFENLSLDVEHFNHIGHLRLCWLYLQDNALADAIEKTCTGIQSYAASLGATDKFHRTITEFLVRLIKSRIDSETQHTFGHFLSDNTDLVENARGLLSQFYSESVLRSAPAKVHYIEPDLINLTA